MIGNSLIEIGGAFLLIVSLSEILNSIIEANKFDSKDELVNNKTAGIFNAFFSLGAIIGPILSGFINDQIGFRLTNDMFGFITVGFFIIYTFTNTTLDDFKWKSHNNKF